MQEQFSRTQRLIGREKMDALAQARVAVFGVGGVGGYVVEALARSGIGALDLIDNDTVCLSNLNRQIIALHSTIGRYKVDAAAERAADINPQCRITVHKCFFLPETEDQFDFTQYDYVVDAIDTVSGKIALVMKAQAAGTPVISCMGAGNKLDAAAFEVADIYQTSVCPLAKVMRRELKKRGVKKLKVVYSRETALTPIEEPEDIIYSAAAADVDETQPKQEQMKVQQTVQQTVGGAYETAADAAKSEQRLTQPGSAPTDQPQPVSAPRRRATPGSMPYVPGAAGLIIAGEVIRDLAEL